jgi:hypothetical protein
MRTCASFETIVMLIIYFEMYDQMPHIVPYTTNNKASNGLPSVKKTMRTHVYGWFHEWQLYLRGIVLFDVCLLDIQITYAIKFNGHRVMNG